MEGIQPQTLDELDKVLDGYRSKMKPGQILKLKNSKGQFFYQRDDRFDGGFKLYMKPSDEEVPTS